MDKNIRIVLTLLFLIVIPFLIYAFLQVKSLKNDEKLADSIYEKQMETVLFSLNQYADDMMAQWIRKLADENESLAKNASDLVLGNESIQLLVIRQITNGKDSLCFNDYVSGGINSPKQINDWYAKNDSIINKLSNYLTAGFQKIQPANNLNPIDGLKPDQTGITVMLYDKDSVIYNALFILEINYWVEQILGAKMQEIAQDEFRVAVIQESKESETLNIVYSTDPLIIEKDYVQSELWILENTNLVIQAKGVSYSQLIRKRSKNNLYILFFSVLTLFIGAFIMIRNIKNALKVAQLKTDFVSNVSHEIRTPLSLIRMYAETLMLGRLPSDKKKQHYYEVIHHESGRLTYLVNNILDFSKIEANRKTYKLVDADMNKLVNQLYSNYSFSFKENGVKSNLVLSSEPIPIRVDSQAFEEALSNLIENAIKYSDKEPFITITTSIIGNYGYCKVKDMGIGISTNNQTKIFDKFYRGEEALTQKTKGTGLGLNIVKHIIESHQGSITVTSKPNQGSTFIIKLPLQII